jgi:hypothetical protein
MFKNIVLLSLGVFLASCKDNPYREPVVVQPLAKSEYGFNGIVELGTPISGATVSAYQFSKLRHGEKIGEVISGPDGTFNLNLKTNYDGPILLAATGGLYRDLITGETVALKPEQELRSAITHIKMPEKTNINAWTTLAVARVLADRGFWDKSVADLKDIDRINVDFSQVSYFLTGKSTSFVNVRRLEFFDVGKDAFNIDDPRVTLHLSHGGLSRLINDFNAKLAEEGFMVNVIDLVLALSDDLSDRIFDGRNASGNVVYVGNNKRIRLDSYTMRKNLSEAIRLYSQHLQGLGKLSSDIKYELEKPDRLLDSIAKETQPELFPEIDKPKPIDNDPPKLKAHIAGAHRGQWEFPYLNDNVIFEVVTEDDSKVEVKLLEPKLVAKNSNSSFGPIYINQAPQAMDAAVICGKKNELKEQIKKRELSEANIICACFEATDIFGNSSKELSCFQRALPKSTIDYPSNQTVLSTKSFSDGVNVKAHVSSGLPITECSWHIRARLDGGIEEGILPSGKGLMEGTTCTIDEALDGSKFFNGSYYLVVEAADLGGRVLSNKQDGIYQSITNFQVFKEPPTVEVISPANNDFLSTNYIPVFGTVDDPEKISEILVRYKAAGFDDNSLNASIVIPINKTKKEWSVTLGSELPSGKYAFDFLVKDIYGNEKKLPSRDIIIDHQMPTIFGALDGVPQASYLQETINYRQRFVDEKNNPHYVIEPVGEAVPINWRNTPRISRWLTRLNDWQTAPSYTVRVNDDNKVKEVRYKLNYKCSSFDEADQKANIQDDRYQIWFTQNAASFDLSRDSEADGHPQKYCLSIWAIDQAGNASNHNVEFIWKVVSPPVSAEINAGRYRSYLKEDDLASINKPIKGLFRKGSPIGLKNNLVIGHALLANPHMEAISAFLELKKPMELKLSCGKYQIPEKFIDIRFFAYDLAKGQLGPEKTLNDRSVIINANETVIAKFILAKDFPIDGVGFPDDNFWNSLRVEVGFVKTVNDKPFVDGLHLITRDLHTGTISNDFVVPWGDDHDVRRRSPSRSAA